MEQQLEPKESMSEINADYEWVRLLKNGNEDALDKLWVMLFTDGVSIARKYQYEEDIGRDAAVSAFNRICSRGLTQFKFKSTFRSFCWTILTREVYRLSKKLPNTIELTSTTAPKEEFNLTPQLEIVWERLKPCLDKLTPNRRQVFELIDLQKKRPDEVATLLGIRRNNVNQLAVRTRRALKKCLQNQGYLTSEDILSI